MGRAVFHKELRKFEEPSNVLGEAFKNAPNLDLLVTILPGKTDFYGVYIVLLSFIYFPEWIIDPFEYYHLI